MRLTLRSMLAYIDGILEPEDAEQIKTKIEASEFATKLFHRVQDVVERLRLSAPTSRYRGAALDANTVAEYLDNKLSTDRVPDFEKVCLDSDVHLAEVACCHQVLTLILGEPAEVEPALRERVYRLPETAGEEVVAEASEAPEATRAGPPPVETSRKGRRKLAIPEYLREPSARRRRWPVAAAVLLLVALAVVGLVASGQFESGTWLGDLVRRPTAMFARGPEPGPVQTTEQEPAAGTQPSPEIAQPRGVESPPAPESAEGGEPAPTPPESAGPGQTEPDASPDPAASEPPAEAAPGGTEQATGVAEPGQPTGEQVATVEGATTQPPAQPEPGPTEPGPTEPGSAGPEDTPPPGEAVAEGETQTPPRAVPVHPVGHALSETEVLLRFSQARAVWERVSKGTELVAGDVLVAPPDYRPQFALTAGSGPATAMLGETRVVLLAPAGEQPSGIRVDFGRLVFGPTGESAGAVRLAVGDRWGVVRLDSGGSVAAVEVLPVRRAGVHPETGPRAVQAILYCAAGRVAWQPAELPDAVELSGPASLDLGAPTEEGLVAGEPYPAWIAGVEPDPLKARGAANLAQRLQTGRPAGLGLRELAEHRQKEVRWLAVRSLGYLGEFDPMVLALNDAGQQPDWPDYIAELRAAVDRTPQAAAAVRQALEKRFSADAEDLYRMLWGYSNADLEGGEDARLVRALEHPTLAVRVLAFWNLKEITGMGLFYQPEASAVQRRLPYQRWEERLKAGEIRIRARPDEGPVSSPAPQ